MQTSLQSPDTHLTPREQDVYLSSVSQGKCIVTTADAMAMAGASHGHARKILSDLHRKHVLVRAGKGIYAVAPPAALREPGPPPIDPFKVLDQLMAALDIPYYAAYMTAAYLHGGAHEIPFNVDVATPRPRRPVRLGSVDIDFHRVPEERMGGTVRLRQAGEYLTVSDVEKTLLDCADRLDLCGGADGLAQVVWELAPSADAAKLGRYAEQDGRPHVIQRLGYVLARLAYMKPSRVPRALYKALAPRISDNAYPLDPALGRTGPLDDYWNVRVNTDIMGWLTA